MNKKIKGYIMIITISIVFALILQITLKNNNKDKIDVITCVQTNSGENGNNSYIVSSANFRNNKLVYTTDTLTQEVEIEQLNGLYAMLTSEFEKYNDIKGYSYKIFKSSENSVTVIQKINFIDVNREELGERINDSEYVNEKEKNPVLTKNTTLSEYKEDFITDEKICEY